MLRTITCLTALVALSASASAADSIRGQCLETRTCQVYTGPCFANAEVGLTGKNAIMAWSIREGKQNGVSLNGLKVVVVVNSQTTLGFQGVADAKNLKSVILVDSKANKGQRNALIAFAKKHAGRAGQAVVGIRTTAINMTLNEFKLKANLTAGKEVKILTRKARPEDCICSNESKYYPPLAKVNNFAAGVTIEGKFSGRGLGTRWSTPGARSAYMGTFTY